MVISDTHTQNLALQKLKAIENGKKKGEQERAMGDKWTGK